VFNKVSNHHDDPIEALYLRASNDTRPDVLNLGIGVYRDEFGNAPIFECVQLAEQRILETSTTKGYTSPFGNKEYIKLTEELVFGKEHPALTDKRIISAQCPGAGAGLRIGAELTRSLNANAQAWFSNPVWEHQINFFSQAGLAKQQYAYYDSKTFSIDFPAMLSSLQGIKPGDLVVIHGCCHNPTGADLTLEQWRQLTDFLLEKQVIPFVDIAYQGYGTSIGEDVLGVQHMASKMDNMLVAVSSSKSFAVYRDRAGLISVIHSSSHSDRHSLARYVRDIIRGTYFMPPEHAAAVIAEILKNNDLEQSWRNEIDIIRNRIKRCRNALASAISLVDPTQPIEHLKTQKGMFSSFPLSTQQLKVLEEEHRIYLLNSGRINFAAMTENHAERIAKSIYSVQSIPE